MDFLKKLGLKKRNAGTWTGQHSTTSNLKYLNSFSPVDGLLIGSVSRTSKEEYELI